MVEVEERGAEATENGIMPKNGINRGHGQFVQKERQSRCPRWKVRNLRTLSPNGFYFKSERRGEPS